MLLQSYSDEFNLEKKCHNTPAAPGTVLKKLAEDGKVLSSEDQTILRSGIGKFMYHMQCSRLDIAQAVRDLARHMRRGDDTHMQAMLRSMQYLKRAKDAGLILKPTTKWDGTNQFQFKIKGRSDSDYAKDMQIRQSILGYMVFLKDAPVMHRGATQKTVALSSCKVEMNAAVLCVQDMLYAKNQIESIGLKVELLRKLEIDNKRTVDLNNSFSVGGCTLRHIDIKQCFLRELKEAKQLVVNWIPGSENSTDKFTKTRWASFQALCRAASRGRGHLIGTPSKGDV